MEFMYLVFTRMPRESQCRRLGSFVLLCLWDVFRALINSLVCYHSPQFDTEIEITNKKSTFDRDSFAQLQVPIKYMSLTRDYVRMTMTLTLKESVTYS